MRGPDFHFLLSVIMGVKLRNLKLAVHVARIVGGDRKVYGFFDMANVRKRTMEDLRAEGLSKGQKEEMF
jgi:hypothetical protein